MNIAGILNIIRRECERVLSLRGSTRIGIVDSYDPALYCAKVRIQPENTLTGFVPILTDWVGNGWGLVCPPSAGDVVDVHFQEGGKNAGFISKRFYSSKTLPPGPVASGEFWLVHKSGSFLKFTNDGKVSVNSSSDMDFVSGADINMTAAGNIKLVAGAEAVLHGATAAIVDADGTGIKYQPALVSTFTDGVSTTHSGPTPPAVT
jgi:phage baseplate assembly protein gpV